MLTFEKAQAEDIPYLLEISKTSFNELNIPVPYGYDDEDWFMETLKTGYLYKIVFNGQIIGGFLIYKVATMNFHLDRIFILPSYQNLGYGKKAIKYLVKRYPEAKVWCADIKPEWKKYMYFMNSCGFYECGKKGQCIRFVKLIK